MRNIGIGGRAERLTSEHGAIFAQFKQTINVKFHVQNSVLGRVRILCEQNEILASNADN